MCDEMESPSFLESKQEQSENYPFSPATCYKKLKATTGELKEEVLYKKTEALVNYEEFKSMEESLKDANALLNDGKKTIEGLQNENARLLIELNECKTVSEFNHKESNLKMFRMQQELEQKNLEILRLKKDKSEFDLQQDLIKSRFARREKELMDALNAPNLEAKPLCDFESEIIRLKSEISELKDSEIKRNHDYENLEEVLKIKIEHNLLLSQAFEELLNELKEISAEVTDLQFLEVKELPTLHVPEPLDLTALSAMQTKNIISTSTEFDEFVPSSLSGIDDILQASIADFSAWCKFIIDEWTSAVDFSKEVCSSDSESVIEIISILRTAHSLILSRDECTNEIVTSIETPTCHNISLQTSLTEDDLPKQIDESAVMLKNVTNNYEVIITELKSENHELLKKYNSLKEVLEEAEKQQSLIEETTAEVVRELKDEMGDRAVKMLLNGVEEEPSESFVDVVIKEESQFYQTSGMTTYLSAKDEPEQSVYEEANITTVTTAYALPREHSDNLLCFSKEFAEFLATNQIFHEDEVPPPDPSVFYFLLDKYLILLETYHQVRSAFEENLALEEQEKVTSMKAVALLSQLSQLEVTDSTLCDSSFTASSVDFDTDVRSSTMYESRLNDTSLQCQQVADLTHDPLQITINPPSTPLTNNSRISLRKQTPASHKRNSLSSRIPVSRLSLHSQTIHENSSSQINDSKRPPSTPVQKILRREPCSTAKKSVTFQSPLLAKNIAERENGRLKSLLDERNAEIEKLEHLVSEYARKMEEVEKRIEELESLSSEAYGNLERVEAEFDEKRLKLEEDLKDVKSQLSEVTNKLIVEAINLNPDLQDRLTAITPPQVLTILLNAIIARFEKQEELTKKTFESDREEWSNEMLQLTSNNQILQEQINKLILDKNQMQVQEDEVKVLEEDILRLTKDNIELERANAKFEKESMELQDKLSSIEKKLSEAQLEISSLNDQIFLSEGELACLHTDKAQLEESNEKMGKEYENQLMLLQSSMAAKTQEVEVLQQEITTLKTNISTLEENKSKVEKEYENFARQLEEKDDQLRELEGLKNKILLLENQITVLHEKSQAQLSEEIESLKLELENSTKEKESLQLENGEIQNTCSSLQLSLAQITTEKTEFESRLQSAYSAIGSQSLCEVSPSSDLALQINHVCEFVAKKIADLELQTEKIVGLEKEITDIREEKDKMSAIIDNLRGDTQLLEGKVSELEADKSNVETEIVLLKQRIIDLELAGENLNCAIGEKDALIAKSEAELVQLREQIAVKTEEVGSNEKIALEHLQENEQLIIAKDIELIKLKEENRAITDELVSLKTENEKILSKINDCDHQLASEIEKHKEALLSVDNLQTQVGHLKFELEDVRSLEVARKTEIDVITIEKSRLEECLAAVELNLRLAEERLIAAEKRNAEFESELIELKDELLKNKDATLDLAEKLSILEKIYGEAKREKAELSEELNKLSSLNDCLAEEKKSLNEQLAAVAQERDELVNKLASISESRDLLAAEKENVLSKLEEVQGNENENLTRILQELSEFKAQMNFEIDSFTGEINTLKANNISLQTDKENLSDKLSELNEKYDSDKMLLIKQVEELVDIRALLSSEKENLLKDLSETKIVMKELNEQNLELLKRYADVIKQQEECMKENQVLNEKLSNLARATDALEAEKNLLASKLRLLTESMVAFHSEKDLLAKELQIVVDDRTDLLKEKTTLESKLAENVEATKGLIEEKSILICKLDEVIQSRAELEAARIVLEDQVKELSEKVDKLTSEVTIKSQNISELTDKLQVSESDVEKLRENLDEYQKTESTMLKKLLEKNNSDELALRLQSQLSDAEGIIVNMKEQVESLKISLKEKTDSLEAADSELFVLRSEIKTLNNVINNLTKDKDELDNNFKIQASELRHKSKSLDDVTVLMENLKCQVTQKEKENEEVNSLLNERTEKISNLNTEMEKLSNNNAELKELLGHVQVSLGLPKEAVEHLSADQNTRSYFRLFKENVDGYKTRNHAISMENEKLTIELEKLTTEKVQFKVREAELRAVGLGLEDQLQALTSKLAKLEAAPGRRSKKHDPIGPRRLEKLEELNTTLHDLLLKLLSMLKMPNVDKLRLISQREVDGATKQILEHAASLANARESLESLTERVTSLDQENQELSDNFEALLKDNNQLELKILELEKANKSSGAATSCLKCSKLQKSLKEKTDEVEELNNKVKELDEENQSLGNDVEALLKDNNKLELALDELKKGSISAKTCSECSTLKKKLKLKDGEISDLDLSIKKHLEKVKSLESELDAVKEKCESLESSLSNREQHLLRAINDRVRGDEVRMSGATGGLVRDIDLNEKVRRLTKDNDALKVLLRERARTIKKYEAEQKIKTTPNKETNVVLNTNCMNSPIRERGYNLRTRADLHVTKNSHRPHSEGFENLRL